MRFICLPYDCDWDNKGGGEPEKSGFLPKTSLWVQRNVTSRNILGKLANWSKTQSWLRPICGQKGEIWKNKNDDESCFKIFIHILLRNWIIYAIPNLLVSRKVLNEEQEVDPSATFN